MFLFTVNLHLHQVIALSEILLVFLFISCCCFYGFFALSWFVQYAYEDTMDLAAKLPTLAAAIYRNLYRDGKVSTSCLFVFFFFTKFPLEILNFIHFVICRKINTYLHYRVSKIGL